jgi:streptogramin lyase
MKHSRVAMLFVLLVALFLLVTVEAYGRPSGTLEEWDTTPLRPYDIAVLSDGSAWLTVYDEDNVSNIVFTINPADGSITEFVAPFAGAEFQTLDRAPDDTLWIADYELHQIVHFDPTTGVFTGYPLDAAFGTNPNPFGVRVAPDGSVWFTCWGDRSLGRFDPVGGTWDRFDPSSDPPVDIAFSDDGATVWFTMRSGLTLSPGLGRLDPATGSFDLWTSGVADPFISPYGIAVVDNFVWFLDHHANLLVRFDPSTEDFTFFDTLPELEDAHFFAVDNDGVFWITAFVSSAIGTFDPATGVFDYLSLSDSEAHPMGISVSPTGDIWWAETFDTGRGGVGRFSPAPEPQAVPVDIKPASCPNPLNVDGRGVLPVAILGTGEFDVTQVDPASVTLAGVSPLRWDWEDVATPFGPPFVGKEDAYDCIEEGPDGYMDLTLKFDTQEVVAALGEVSEGNVLVLQLTGTLLDANPFVGEDVVVVLKKGKP